MQNLKCPNCGADITTDDAQTSGRCPYCNSRFAAEKKPEPTYTPEQQKVIEDFQPTNTPIFTVDPNKPRPRVRLPLLILFLMLGPIFFIGYIVITELKKSEWDKKHNR